MRIPSSTSSPTGSTSSRIIKLSILGIILSSIYQCIRPYHGTYDSQSLPLKYGKWAIVIGASEGLGAEWASLLCKNGMNVITVARRANELQQQANKLSHEYSCLVKPLVLDLTDSENVTSVLEHTLRTTSTTGSTSDGAGVGYDVGLMVYNAAVFNKGSFLGHSLDSQLATIRVNVESLTRAVHAFGNYVREKQQQQQQQQQHQEQQQQQQTQTSSSLSSSLSSSSSGLIIMSSSLGDQGSAHVATYAATKAFDTVFAQSLAHELFQDVHMDVLGCVAGPINTPNFQRANGKNAADRSDMKFMIQTPSEVASECLHALGQKRYSISTGRVMKVIRFVTNRFVPTRMSVDFMSKTMQR
eukprot:CAMPEP_0176481042 /NCGR_PEP_ID=MMETSP0200_2-20121128/2602_1 /TAXON_ID=947934 /ORGANISM="Chaetoceros sp., Strain GSL56" /LENGTH=356 /DNA_ID=CAMNT_0017877207 /DNA_START=18 /DNA_END=1088 /DNA_ORIENTATION=+